MTKNKNKTQDKSESPSSEIQVKAESSAVEAQNKKESVAVDHSLALKVAEEVIRMRTRMSNMSDDIVGLKALKKALDRLEEKLNDLEYEIINLVGQPYNEGLTVQARFVVSSDLQTGEREIAKMHKPQVNYKGTLIQSAEVEVNFGE